MSGGHREVISPWQEEQAFSGRKREAIKPAAPRPAHQSPRDNLLAPYAKSQMFIAARRYSSRTCQILEGKAVKHAGGSRLSQATRSGAGAPAKALLPPPSDALRQPAQGRKCLKRVRRLTAEPGVQGDFSPSPQGVAAESGWNSREPCGARGLTKHEVQSTNRFLPCTAGTGL